MQFFPSKSISTLSQQQQQQNVTSWFSVICEACESAIECCLESYAHDRPRSRTLKERLRWSFESIESLRLRPRSIAPQNPLRFSSNLRINEGDIRQWRHQYFILNTQINLHFLQFFYLESILLNFVFTSFSILTFKHESYNIWNWS